MEAISFQHGLHLDAFDASPVAPRGGSTGSNWLMMPQAKSCFATLICNHMTERGWGYEYSKFCAS